MLIWKYLSGVHITTSKYSVYQLSSNGFCMSIASSLLSLVKLTIKSLVENKNEGLLSTVA